MIEEAGRWADRISINIELPTPRRLPKLAPEKNLERTRAAMSGIRERIESAKAERDVKAEKRPRLLRPAKARK